MSQADSPPPEAQLFQALFGFMVTRTLSAVAELNVADELRDGPLHCAELAEAVGADQRSLQRAMRVLVSTGIFAEPEPGTFALTPVSNLLRSDLPGSLRNLSVMLTAESHWTPWSRLTDAIRTGSSGSQHAFGTDLFSWFQRAENRSEWELFNAAMTSFSSVTSQAVAETYDFSSFTRIVDIGGGHGLLLHTLLAQAPDARGVLFDMPGVVSGASETLEGRIECVGGDFFEGVPSGGDCYVTKHILHDWSDEQCQTLLRNIANVMQPDGKVLVLEMVMPETGEPHPAKFMDVNMLAMTEGGTERTASEFANLFESAGLELQTIHPTKSPVCIVEGTKA